MQVPVNPFATRSSFLQLESVYLATSQTPAAGQLITFKSNDGNRETRQTLAVALSLVKGQERDSRVDVE